MKNPQTTIALTFLTHIISDIDGVQLLLFPFHLFSLTLFLLLCFIVGEEVADYDTLQ